MAYTETCCRSGGSNLNAGTRTGNATEPGTAASFTYASGNWVASTGVFTVASGNPATDGIVAGDFASVYANGSTQTGFVGRVTAASATTITVSLTAKAGTAPVDGTATRTLKIGGAWQGPNGANAFPFNFAAGTLTNVAGDTCRVNFKNDATYAITTPGITHSPGGPVYFQGYTTSYGDLGKATIDGGTAGASYILWQPSGSGVDRTLLVDLIFQNNGATGTAAGIAGAGDQRTVFLRCVVHDVRGWGFDQVGSIIECEAYKCNKSATADSGGIYMTAGGFALRCISHHNTGSFVHGFYCQGANVSFVDCISANNGGCGIYTNAIAHTLISGCDVYSNGFSGLYHATGAAWHLIENCNFINNTGYGINIASGSMRGFLSNCGFGGNTSGAKLNTGFMSEVGTVTYGASQTPWIAPTTGDFRINNASAKGAGRDSFTQTDTTSWSTRNTIGYPDIGAAQHQDMSVKPTYGVGI